jgi:hypothetical protein
MSAPGNRPVLVRRVNFWWYLVALVPIVGLIVATGYGWVSPMLGIFAFFLAMFWLFSLGFAIWGLFRKQPKEPRQ